MQILSPPPCDEYPYDLGSYGRKVRTASSDCQRWFDRGLIWSYGFHHEEAVLCFKYAAYCDPTCAMAYWGIAYAGGPNYNKAWERFDEDDMSRSIAQCHEGAETALRLAHSPVERGLALALTKRFPSDQIGDHEAWNLDFSSSMEDLYATCGDDLDVAAVYADSMMAMAPWQLWDLHTGKPRDGCRTLEIRTVLERAMDLEGAHEHPGILHFYTHLMELSFTPEIALPAADRLRGLVPDSGHLNHMPAHLDLLIGDYRRAIASNLDAIRADEKYMRHGSSVNFYTFYRLHDYTFPIYAGMFNGQCRVCMEVVERMEKSLTEEFMRLASSPMIDWNEGFKSYRLHVLIRFGKWYEVLSLPFPNDRAFYCVTTALLHYGRGVAYSVLGNIAAAAEEQRLFRDACTKIVPTRFDFPNSWDDILAVADAMLSGELEYRRGDHETAFTQLRAAIHRSDNLIYAEPWGWMQPPRHAYAALQLEQGNVEEAARVYAEDLEFDHAMPRAVRHPNNVWALHGFHECLVKLGRDAEARILEPQLTLALAIADISIESSCFCRRTAPAANQTACCTE